jgi:hypothetical protein
MTSTAGSPNRRAYLLLSSALAASFVLAFPMEQVRHKFSAPGDYWVSHSCGVVANSLNLGSLLQAILTPIFVFLLPGAGSILKNKSVSLSRRALASFIAAGWLCAALISIGWWYGIREYARLHGECPALFDWNLPIHTFQPDYLSDVVHYFIYLSAFSSFWIGTIAGGLRLQSARAAVSGSGANESRRFQRFYWVCFLGWAAQYRANQWISLGANPHQQEWPLFALVDFLFVTGSSLWVLAFIHSLWKKKPRSWLDAVFQAFWRSFVILLLTLLSFFWLLSVAVRVLAPLATWNVFGLGWALVVGTLRWNALQEQRSSSVVNL